MKLFDKQSMALLVSVISISVLCIISVSYAYFTTQIKGNENATSIELVMGTMKIKYEDSNLVTLNNAIPGDTIKHNFKVTNTGTLETTYNIKLDIEKNNFRDKSDLEYTLTRNGSVIKTDKLPYEDGYIVVGEEIGTEEETKINNYELEVRFKKDEEDKDQNDNKNRELKFKIVIDAKEEASLYEFVEPYKDASGANYPELYEGLIPITYNENNEIEIAKITEEWYNYDEHEWANAVLIDHNNPEIVNKFYKEDGTLRGGETITEDDILQMYVWIPRYKYQLFNANNKGVDPQVINITFEKNDYSSGNVTCSIDKMGKETCENAINGNWYTHPAFTFGETELRGIWVGKFEPSDPTDPNGRTKTTIDEITILPNKTSIVLKDIITMFNITRNIESYNKYKLDYNEIDTHMMKNMEWGAVAYFSSSKYGIYSRDSQSCNIKGMNKEDCEIWINNTSQGAEMAEVTNVYGGTHTGCAGENVSAAVKWNEDDGSVAKCDEDKKWNTENGVKASTTGNIYGIYDMAGGAWEYMMGLTINQNGTGPCYSYSGFTKDNMPDEKYYDLYGFSDNIFTHQRGHLGDSTRETLSKFGDASGGWNDDWTHFPSIQIEGEWNWFLRGGVYYATNGAGIFAFLRTGGGRSASESFRITLTAQDGED